MQFKFVLEINKLKAANICASTEEIRLYLNGVALRIRNGIPQLWATDGHRLVRIDLSTNERQGIPTEDACYIIPREFISQIKTEKKVKFVECAIDGDIFSIKSGTSVWNTKLIDGTFPDVERVTPTYETRDIDGIPVAAQSHAMSFQAAYLSDFGKIAKMLGGNGGITITNYRFDNKEPKVIQAHNNPDLFFGVLMPMRDK